MLTPPNSRTPRTNGRPAQRSIVHRLAQRPFVAESGHSSFLVRPPSRILLTARPLPVSNPTSLTESVSPYTIDS